MNPLGLVWLVFWVASLVLVATLTRGRARIAAVVGVSVLLLDYVVASLVLPRLLVGRRSGVWQVLVSAENFVTSSVGVGCLVAAILFGSRPATPRAVPHLGGTHVGPPGPVPGAGVEGGGLR